MTTQTTDLDARLSNAGETEKRLVAVLQQRTGKVADVLEVEREIARVREQIERMTSERVRLRDRVTARGGDRRCQGGKKGVAGSWNSLARRPFSQRARGRDHGGDVGSVGNGAVPDPCSAVGDSGGDDSGVASHGRLATLARGPQS